MEDPDKMNRTGKIRKRLFTVLLAAAMSLGAFFQAGASDDGVHLEIRLLSSQSGITNAG